ncbi:hypothetical protein GSUET_06010 [Geobacter sulfurreducens subsp. ethanolicus]|uniref:ATP-binding protein n=1 Tax=Geobacter sulfurreducens TaxID=35554 RepID=UPI00257241F8|nr:ATP-binding protein [Geobacter sulfurreducens]BEH08989.1 hypothetical protein GSUET_06010 [Geobacter sulfurreducens subsp. ethanolicus]
MKIKNRIIGAAVLVVMILAIGYSFYFLDREHTAHQLGLQTTIEETNRLMKVVTAGPLYDGNLEQLNACLDSFFTNPDILKIELRERTGGITLSRTRPPIAPIGVTINSQVVITRGQDELGDIISTYSTARNEQDLQQVRTQLIVFTGLLLLILTAVIWLIARGISSPIERLTKVAQAMANGNLDQDIHVSGAQELHSLGESFIRMRDAIRDKMEKLETQNEILFRTQYSIDRAREAVFWVRPDGSYSYVNDAACALLGYSREELLAIKAFELDPAYGGERWQENWRMLKTRGSAKIEALIKAKDSRLIPVEVAIDLIDYNGEEYQCAYCRDITERKRASEILAASNRLLQTIINTVPMRVFWKDTELRYMGCNRAFARDAGIAHPDEVIGKDDYQFWQELAEHYRDDDQAVINSGVPKLSYVEPFSTGDGGLRWFCTSKVPLRNEEQVTIGILGVYEDITEQKLAEEERKLLEEQLIQAQKMESIGRLAGGVAHDFNNLLTPIFGYSELLKNDLPGNEKGLNKLGNILMAAEKAKALVQQLLSFSRKQVMEMTVIDLNSVIRAFQGILRHTIRESIDIRLHLTEESYSIRADRNQLEQVIMNLVVNAQDAIDEHGVITIETAPVLLDDEYAQQHQEITPGRYLQLAITDNGCGMDQETRQRIFEPFFTTKGIGQGTGLGLATVYGIVRQHRGNIWVYSEPDKGTTFKCYFPLVDEALTSERFIEHDPVSLAGEQRTILLVEDNEMVRTMVNELLTKQGFEVLVAEDPKQARQSCKGRSLDMLITDVVMPYMSGLELHAKLLESYPGLKVLYMSGYTSNVIVHQGVLDEGINLIQKPFAITEFARRVETILTSSV